MDDLRELKMQSTVDMTELEGFMENMGKDEERRQTEVKSEQDRRVREAMNRQTIRHPMNNTDNPQTPPEKRALNNPTGQDEGLSGYRGDSPLVEPADTVAVEQP